MSIEYHITLTDEQEAFLQAHSSIIGDNYFMPYWFRRIEGNKFEMLPLGNLPESMSAEIKEMREQVLTTNLQATLDRYYPLKPGEMPK